jgi:hypothetical protein
MKPPHHASKQPRHMALFWHKFAVHEEGPGQQVGPPCFEFKLEPCLFMDPFA